MVLEHNVVRMGQTLPARVLVAVHLLARIKDCQLEGQGAEKAGAPPAFTIPIRSLEFQTNAQLYNPNIVGNKGG